MSLYMAGHAAEDWAEMFVNYLHIRASLDTFGLVRFDVGFSNL